MITAQDILVDNSSYPTEEIGRNAQRLPRTGPRLRQSRRDLLMALGMPYDSDQGRSYAAAITALMTGEAYLQSARIAGAMGPFEGYAVNREPMLQGDRAPSRTCLQARIRATCRWICCAPRASRGMKR